MLFLALVVVLTARMGVADYFSLRRDGPMDERPVDRIENTEAASRSIDIALSLDPYNPNDWQARARLDCLGIGSPEQDSAALHSAALAAIRRAIALRPVSSHGWATLLEIKADSGEIDSEFMLALHNAIKLGPWEAATQRVVSAAGLEAWPSLPEFAKQEVLGEIKRGMMRQPAEILRIALEDSRRSLCR